MTYGKMWSKNKEKIDITANKVVISYLIPHSKLKKCVVTVLLITSTPLK